MNLQDGPQPPTGVTGDVMTPTVLYNGMIAPLLPLRHSRRHLVSGRSQRRREPQYH